MSSAHEEPKRPARKHAETVAKYYFVARRHGETRKLAYITRAALENLIEAAYEVGRTKGGAA